MACDIKSINFFEILQNRNQLDETKLLVPQLKYLKKNYIEQFSSSFLCKFHMNFTHLFYKFCLYKYYKCGTSSLA